MIYAISDLHLPSSSNKKQNMFGEIWVDHPDTIRDKWMSKIKEDDIVLIPGDISWAMKWDEAEIDLQYLAALPGKKILSEGNHDYWLFNRRNKKKKWLQDYDNEISSMRFIHNDAQFVTIGENSLGIAAAKGWSHNIRELEADEKLINRQLGRLKRSIEAAKSGDKLIVMTHYPPTNQILRSEQEGIFQFERFDERFWEMISSYEPDAVIFGHLHDVQIPIFRRLDDIPLYCVSADIIDFNPVEIVI